jgi:hypothetical protein
MPSKHEALSLIPSTGREEGEGRRRKEKKGEEEGGGRGQSGEGGGRGGGNIRLKSFHIAKEINQVKRQT